jgi:hypothetical protein
MREPRTRRGVADSPRHGDGHRARVNPDPGGHAGIQSHMIVHRNVQVPNRPETVQPGTVDQAHRRSHDHLRTGDSMTDSWREASIRPLALSCSTAESTAASAIPMIGPTTIPASKGPSGIVANVIVQ